MSTRTVLRLVILSVFLFLCYLSCCVDKSEGAYTSETGACRDTCKTRWRLWPTSGSQTPRDPASVADQTVYYNRAVQPFPGSTITHRTVNTGPVLPPIYLPPILPNGCGGRCGRNAVCLGGHTCVCLPTYKGNPLTVCHPGGGPCGNRCGIRARCLTGTGKCVCNPGYYGNPLVACFPGYRCRRGCGVNAVCDRRQGLCKCRPGYIGNPHYQCVSLAGCRGGCGPNAVCNRKRHACVCVKGTGPNPVIGCKPLPCEGRCGKNALCKNGACVCTTGCAGDPYTRCFYVQ
uniref:Tenascin-R n=1 Tax=Magallana gigas TaxID=29159 RepID=K1R013_MAGGI